MDHGILLAIVVSTATELVAILLNDRQLNSIRSELSATIDRVHGHADSKMDGLRELRRSFDRLREEMNAGLDAQIQATLHFEQTISARLQRLEERLP